MKKRRKKGETTKLKETLWQLCRALTKKYYGITCYTCGKEIPKGIHTGHFITSSTCSVDLRYHLGNLRPQCYHCNINLSGNWVAFEAALIKEGNDIELLKQRNKETKGKVYDVAWFQAKIKEYDSLL